MTTKISAEELAHLPDTSIPFADGSGYIAELAVYHELHCVVRIHPRPFLRISLCAALILSLNFWVETSAPLSPPIALHAQHHRRRTRS